jgi:hypothetical protein
LHQRHDIHLDVNDDLQAHRSLLHDLQRVLRTLDLLREFEDLRRRGLLIDGPSPTRVSSTA